MKRIYIVILLVNAFVFNMNAQKQWCYTNYLIDSIAYNPVQGYYAGTSLAVQFDTLSAAIPIGFNFNFYGNDFSSVVISPNGYLTFDLSKAGMMDNVPLIDSLPDAAFTHYLVAIFASNMRAWSSTNIYYSTIGTAPNRQFVVSYDSLDYAYFPFGSFSTGQIVLYETSNIIEMYVAGNGVFINEAYMLEGVQNGTGTLAASVPGRNGDSTYYIRNDARRFTQTNIPDPAPSICMVSVDSATGKNIIIWDKSNGGLSVDSFIIYKETDVSGVYAQIGIQPYSTYSTFIDTGSYPSQQANRYEIGFLDSCGIVSLPSDVHKTIHLNINQGIGNTWNLIWDAYQGFNYGSFNVYRGTNPTNMTLLTTIASSLYSYTDLNPPVGQVYYLIGVDNPNPCTPARTESGSSFSSSISNIVNNQVLGLQSSLDESSISVFPNPANDKLLIHFSSKVINENINVSFMNMLGETMQEENLNGTDDISIDIKTLSAGIYFLQIKSDNGSVVKKFVKQ